MAVDRSKKMRESIIVFTEGVEYTYYDYDGNPSVNEGKPEDKQTGAFIFKGSNGDLIRIFPNQFTNTVKVVEREGDSTKFVKTMPRYRGGFVDSFVAKRKQSSTYADMIEWFNGCADGCKFKCVKRDPGELFIKGFNSEGKPSNSWADATNEWFITTLEWA